MPRKPPIDPVRWTPPTIDPLPDFGPAELTIVPMPGHGPEDVVVDASGQLWTGLQDGRIVRVSPEGDTAVVADTGGRPLGLHIARDGRALTFCSNVTETADGAIYFTESTSRFHIEHYPAAVLEARGAGSLFRLAPDGAVTTVVDGLYFANGLTTTADESALVFAETQGRRLSKYWLTGPRAGSVTPLVVHLPGYPDNISTGSDGLIWVAMVSPPNAAAEWLAPRPPLIRKLVWRLPERLQPKIPPRVWVLAFDADTGEALAGVRTTHPDFGTVTGIVESSGRLWMSTIAFPALAHTDLPLAR